MSSQPTSQFSDSAAAFEERLSGADWERGRGDELITINTAALRKLLVVALMAAAIGLGVVGQDQLAYDREEFSGLVYWGVALAFFVAGLWLARGLVAETVSATAENPARERTLALSTEVVLLSCVLAVGIFFRFFRIADIPPGLNHDAGWFGLYSIRIHQDPAYSWFWTWLRDPYVACCGAVGNETMFLYVIAFFQVLLGPIQFAIELAAITVGLATLVAFYFLVRRLFDVRLALIATFLLAVSGWHITFSKVGWTAILVPLFVCLTFYFLVKAIQERRMRDFFLAGIFLGLSLDTYSLARILPFIAGAYIIYEIARSPALLRTHYLHLGLFGVAAVIGFSPLGWYALNHWDVYTSRANDLWIGDQIEAAGSLEPLWINIKNALLMFNFRGNGDDFFVQEPLLDMPMSVFFTLGLVYSLLRVRQRGYFLMTILLFLTLVVGVASKPNGNRNIAAVLPVTAFAAIFLFEAWRWLSDAYPRYRDVVTVGLVAVLLYVGWTSFDSYLGPEAGPLMLNRRDQWGFYPETTRVGRYMDKIAKDYEIHAAAGNWPRDALTYLSYQGKGDPFERVYTYTVNATELLSIPPAIDRGTAYIVEASGDNQQVIELLQSRFPAAETDKIYYPDGSDTIIAYAIRVPPGGGALADLDAVPLPRAAEGDAGRRQELQAIVDALAEYRARTGAFPDTGDNIQTACVYLDLDVLCELLPQLGGDQDAFIDPRGDATAYGYWYASDGTSFTLLASLEGVVPEEEKCTPEEAALIARYNLACFRSGE